jgi:hypothetical protein
MTTNRPSGHEQTPNEVSDRRRAELRRYVGAYFQVAGWLASFGMVLQITAVALATLPWLRTVLQPLTNWIVLGLAGMSPLARSYADDAKRTADDILRRIEMSDGLGTPIRAIVVEQAKEDSSALIDYLARRQPMDLKPYASPLVPGPARLIENVREAAWWSARLARELARWEYFWAGALALACKRTLSLRDISIHSGDCRGWRSRRRGVCGGTARLCFR